MGAGWRLNTSPEFTLGLKLLQEAPAPVHSGDREAEQRSSALSTMAGERFASGGVLYSHG